MESSAKPPDSLLDAARAIIDAGGAPDGAMKQLVGAAFEEREELITRLTEAYSPIDELSEGMRSRFDQLVSHLGRETVSTTFAQIYTTVPDNRKAPVVGTTAVSTGRSKRRGPS